MNRKPWEELLFLYLTGTLSKEDRAEFERYLSQSESYRTELDEWRKLAESVRQEADARLHDLPPLTPAFYQRLQTGSKPSLNGSHSAQTKERNIMTAMQVITFEPHQKTRPSISLTLIAALVAVIIFAAVFLFINGQKPDGDMISGVQIQREPATSTPFPTMQRPVATATIVPVQVEPLNIPATAIIVEATQRAVSEIQALTFTPTPIPASNWPATPVPWTADSATMLPPTVPPIIASATPLRSDPIISSPAQLIKEIRLPTGDANLAMAWSPDGKTIAAAGYQGTWLYNADYIDGAARLLPNNGTGVLELAFSADSRLLATLNADKTLRIWDVETGIQLAEMLQSPLWEDLQFSADGRYLISKNSDQKINLSGLQEGLLEAEPLTSADLSGYYALLSPDGETLAAYKGGSVLLLNFETSEVSGNFDWPSAAVSLAAYSRDGQHLALGGDKEVIVVAAGGGYQNSMSTLWTVTGLSFNSDATMLASTMQSANLQSLWLMNMIPGNTFYTAIFVYDLPLTGAIFSPTGNQLVVGTEDGRLFLLEVSH